MIIDNRGSSRSGGSPSNVTATVIDQLLSQSALQKYIDEVLIPSYAKRYYAMMEAVRKYLEPLGVKTSSENKLAGGYFVWIDLPPPLRAKDVVQRALDEENVLVGDGPIFQVQGDPAQSAESFEDNIRLSFAWDELEKLPEGVRKLALVIERMEKSESV